MTRRAVSASRSRPRWLAIVFLAVLLVPIIEIAVIIAVGRVIGAWPTLLLLVAESAFGAWLVRREGNRAWGALRDALRSGRMPSRQLADAALVLIGGTLLLTPGFVTDVVGFAFIAPLTRPVARHLLETAVAKRLLGDTGGWPGGRAGPGAGTGPDVVPGEVVD